MAQVYHGEFSSFDDMVSYFGVTDEQRSLIAEVSYAKYDCPEYEGYADVYFRGTDGRLYEVHGSHCSCFGLEGQWEPDETSAVAILLRPDVPAELREVLVAEGYQAVLKRRVDAKLTGK